MRKIHRLFFLLFCISLISGLLDAESIKKQMTPEQFAMAGLNKLSPGELAYLSDWLDGKVVEEKEKIVAEIVPEGDNRFGAAEQIQRNVEKIRPEPKEIQSRILGSFSGWKGKGVFELENGQIWKQADSSRFSIRRTDPVVIIKKGMLGAYYLNIEGFGTRVKVKRVK